MKWIVSFDISDDRRRRKAVKVLLAAGYRVQKSVFEAELSKEAVQRLRDSLALIIDTECDTVRLYPSDKESVAKTILLGSSVVIETRDYAIL